MNRLLAAPVAITALLLLLLAAVGMGWIWLRTGRPAEPELLHVVMLLLPIALLVVVVMRAGNDDDRLARGLWIAFMIGALWPAVYALRVGAAASEGGSAGGVGGGGGATAATTANDLTTALQRYERLFDGAVNDLVQRDMGQVEYMRTAMFMDGTSLELYHLPFPGLASNYADTWTRAFMGGAARASRNRDGLLTADDRYARVYTYGNDVLAVMGSDPAKLQERFEGWRLPPSAPSRGTDRTRGRGLDQWPFAVGYGLTYVVVAVLLVSWLAMWVSFVRPLPGVLAADERTMRARLLSLPAAIPQLEVEEGPRPDEVRVVYRYRSGVRNMQIRLRLDALHRRVFARTYQGVAGDAPLTAEEARMHQGRRPPGEVHPDADVIWSSTWSVTPRDAEVRRQLRVRVFDDEVELPRRVAEPFATDVGVGADLLPHLLTEVVQQSGWSWRAGLLFQ